MTCVPFDLIELILSTHDGTSNNMSNFKLLKTGRVLKTVKILRIAKLLKAFKNLKVLENLLDVLARSLPPYATADTTTT